ncbi:hypothetical protein [Thermosporothrix hazakensis]|nr:hypothetical protein [Thermosporothrix hazakensis]
MPKIGTKPEQVPVPGMEQQVRVWWKEGGVLHLVGERAIGHMFPLRERDQDAVEAYLSSSGEQVGANADDEEETSSQVAVVRDGGLSSSACAESLLPRGMR